MVRRPPQKGPTIGSVVWPIGPKPVKDMSPGSFLAPVASKTALPLKVPDSNLIKFITFTSSTDLKQIPMEGFKLLWETMESMDQTSNKVAYAAGVGTGLAGIAAGAVVATRTAFCWAIDRYDEFETRAIERIIRKIEMSRRNGSKGN